MGMLRGISLGIHLSQSVATPASRGVSHPINLRPRWQAPGLHSCISMPRAAWRHQTWQCRLHVHLGVGKRVAPDMSRISLSTLASSLLRALLAKPAGMLPLPELLGRAAEQRGSHLQTTLLSLTGRHLDHACQMLGLRSSILCVLPAVPIVQRYSGMQC